jgi:putative transposase
MHLPCTGYLGHPFKNMLLEKGIIFPPCLQTKVGEDKIGSRQHARTTTISCKGEALFVGRFLTHLLRLRGCCLDILQSHFVRWTKPLSPSLLIGSLADLSRSKSQLLAENALLRQQLIILHRQVKRPACTRADRTLLVLLARLVHTWEQALFIVQPETLLRWHRELFSLIWKHRSKAASHQPRVAAETVALIREMAVKNRLWGAERIRGELLKPGIHVCKRTIQKYIRRVRSPQPRGQKWSTFLCNHATDMWACDALSGD